MNKTANKLHVFWKQTSAPQGHPYPPVKSKYLNGISTLNHLSIHQWVRSAIFASHQLTSPIGFPFLKLSPPPCAVLLVINYTTTSISSAGEAPLRPPSLRVKRRLCRSAGASPLVGADPSAKRRPILGPSNWEFLADFGEYPAWLWLT